MLFIFQNGDITSGREWGHVRDVYAFGILAESMLENLQDLSEFILSKVYDLFLQLSA